MKTAKYNRLVERIIGRISVFALALLIFLPPGFFLFTLFTDPKSIWLAFFGVLIYLEVIFFKTFDDFLVDILKSLLRFLTIRRTPVIKKYKREKWQNRFANIGMFNGLEILSKSSPGLLYKYRDWSNSFHRSTLVEQLAFFSSPLNFNDPFDCRIPLTFENMTDSERAEFRKKLASIMANEVQDDPHHLFDELGEFSPIDDNRILRLASFRQDREIFPENTLSKFGLYCLSEDPKNILMWSHYANNHQGICIGFNTQKLLQAFQKHSELKNFHFLDFNKVDYVIDFPEINLNEKLNIGETIFFKKADSWEYEREWRALIYFYHTEKRLLEIPGECIEEIILGCKMNKKSASEVINVARQLNPAVKIFEAKRVRSKYKLFLQELKY